MTDDQSGITPEELKKFSDAGRAIAGAMNVSVELWARAEMGVILKQWAGKTKVRKERPLEISGLLRAYRSARRVAGFTSLKNKGRVGPGQASINLGIRHGADFKVYYRTRRAGAAGGRAGFQDVFGPNFSRGKHITSRDWGAIASFVGSFRAVVHLFTSAAKGAAGLSRQSIVQIADDLGIRLESVKGGGTLSAEGMAKARNALASNGQFYRNGFAHVWKSATSFFIEIVNRYPKGQELLMDRQLQLVIAGRLSYFQRNLEEGTFLSVANTARAYPYLDVLRSAA